MTTDIVSIPWNQLTDSLLLTANRRQASHMVRLYDHYQRGRGKACWSSLNVMPLDAWLVATWLDMPTKEKTLLTDQQALLLWQQIIDTTQNHPLLDSQRTAEQAKQAWELLQAWGVKYADIAAYATDESDAFVNWAQRFQTWCQDNEIIDKNSIPAALIASNSLPLLPAKIILSGFIELTPIIEQLFAQLSTVCEITICMDFAANSGLTLGSWQQRQQHYAQQPLRTNACDCYSIACEDPDDEFIRMCQWAKQQYLADPNASIACIVGNLSGQWDKLERHLKQSLLTDHWLGLQHTPHQPYNLSAGKPLTQFGLIQAAFNILQLASSDIVSFKSLSSLLLSPYLGGGETEMLARATFEVKLREQGETQYPLQLLATSGGTAATPACPLLTKCIHTFIDCKKTLPTGKHLPMVWSRCFDQLLQAIGWPGERNLSSQDYQLQQRWLSLLGEFNQTAAVINEISYHQALAVLKQLAQRSIFQPQTDHAPIQILGVLEAAGLPFDKIWLTQFDQTNWPPAPNPNPFIPLPLARKLNMPHASQRREVQFCQTLLSGFLRNSNTLIMSYAKSNEGQRQMSSTLLQTLNVSDPKPVPTSDAADVLTQMAQTKLAFAEITDEFGPQIAPTTTIQGGTKLFKAQAQCPFRAFAECRLGAEPLLIPSNSLTASDRGLVLHAALESLWQHLNDQATLLAQDDSALTTLINTTVDQAFIPLVKMRPLTLKQQYLALEKERLRHLLQRWLTLEKRREPFRVLAREYRQPAQLAGISVNLQVDRIDELVDGRRLIIDYKTGRPNIADWFGERPTEPQLPLYCLTSSEPISGIAYAQLRPEELKFKGVQNGGDHDPKGVVSVIKLKYTKAHGSWTKLLTDWRTELEHLGTDFRNGNAKVDPKTPKTCQYCQCKAFCRIQNHD